MKVVINSCHGGFGLSKEAMLRYAELKGIKLFVHEEDGHFFEHYTLVPWEEYERVARTKNYKESNKLYFSDRNIPRNDPVLIQVVEELGKKVNSRFSKLKIVKIPDNIEFQIEEYDGLEWVAEKHRTWS